MANNNITGIPELQRMLEQCAKVPVKAMTPATKKGANIIRKSAKLSAPHETGAMEKSIKLKAEKRKTGKKVYQITFVGANLLRITKDGKRFFYPASQEYGFLTPSGKKITPRTAHFMQKAYRMNRRRVEQTVVDELSNSLRSLLGG